MNRTQYVLAKELVATLPWLRKPGMRIFTQGSDCLPLRVVRELGTHTHCVVDAGTFPKFRLPNDAPFFPDLADEATGGILLGLLGPVMVFPVVPQGWRIEIHGASYVGGTLGEACASALLASVGAPRDPT